MGQTESEEPPSDLTPSNPAVGQCWIVGEQPAGEWLGNENCLAAYTSGGWRYLQPFDGLTAFVRSSLFNATYRNGSWEMGIVRADRIEIEGLQVLGQRCDAIADPAGGNVIDVESRTAIASILEALRSHGLIGA